MDNTLLKQSKFTHANFKTDTRHVISISHNPRTNQYNAFGFFSGETIADSCMQKGELSYQHTTIAHAFPDGKKRANLKTRMNSWIILITQTSTQKTKAIGFFSSSRKAYSHIKYALRNKVNNSTYQLHVIQLQPHTKLMEVNNHE